MQVCKQRHTLATTGRLFPSSSSDKVYKVTAYVPNQFDFCSCPSYIFSRSKVAKAEGVHQNTIPGSCKHLDQSLREACDWIQKTDADYRFDQLCPKCHGELVDDGDIEIPDDETAAIDDLRALMANLAGEEAPPPLPKPQEFCVDYTVTKTYRARLTTMTAEEARENFSRGLHDTEELGSVMGEIVAVTPAAEVDAVPPAKKSRAKTATAPSGGPRKKADPSSLVAEAKSA